MLISFKWKNDKISAKIKAEKEILPAPPSAEIFASMMEIVREMLHFDQEQGESDLSLGLRSGEVVVQISLSDKTDKKKLKFTLPT